MEPDRDLLLEIKDALMQHDNKVNIVATNLQNASDRIASSAERMEHAINSLAGQLMILATRANGGSSNAQRALDVAMKVILILVGVLALLTIGAKDALRLLGSGG